MSRRHAELGDRLDALAQAVSLGRDRLPSPMLQRADAVLAQAAQRRRLAPGRTVVALAGGTGSGKSSLFNALAGAALAPTGVRRPTTSRSRAALWPAPDQEGGDVLALLDWLDVPDRHDVTGGPVAAGPVAGIRHLDFAGLLLIDLPDFDSTVSAHRLEADRLTAVVDLLVWVLDPQKYADAAVHRRYLRPLATHADAMVVVLNQIDRLTPAAARDCLRDLRGLLAEDGLGRVPVLATSASTTDGVPELAVQLAKRVRTRAAAITRLNADVDAAVRDLEPACSGAVAARRAGSRSSDQLVRALGDAVGVTVIAGAAGASYRQRAIGRTGWPPTRWLTRLRPDALRRLHLAPGMSGPVTTTSASAADGGGGGALVRAQLANALRDVLSARTGGLAAAWRSSAAETVAGRETALAQELTDAVRSADLSATDRPRWWSLAHAAQLVLLLVAAVGLGWLAVLAGLGALQLPQPSPHVGRVSLPTLLLVGGVLLGLLLALACRPLVAAGARRRQRRARSSMEVEIRRVAQATVLDPLDAEIAGAVQFCAALDEVRR